MSARKAIDYVSNVSEAQGYQRIRRIFDFDDVGRSRLNGAFFTSYDGSSRVSQGNLSVSFQHRVTLTVFKFGSHKSLDDLYQATDAVERLVEKVCDSKNFTEGVLACVCESYEIQPLDSERNDDTLLLIANFLVTTALCLGEE